MAGVINNICQMLGIRQLRMSIYHPQTNGLVEHLNGTSKRLLQWCVQEKPQSWDLILISLLFALRDMPQTSTKLSPLELIFGHKPRGLLQEARKEW